MKPLVLAIILYLLLYMIRFQQGGWDLHTGILDQQRKVLVDKIESFLPSPQAELLSGIVLGEKTQLPSALKLALRDTSTLHMVVVSGQNLTMLAGLVMRLSGFLTRKAAIALTVLAIVNYTLLTGADIPVLRAAVMAGLAYFAQIIGRQSDGAWVLLITAGLFLLINPSWIFDLSFQLSFLATVGVVVVAPLVSSRLAGLPLFLRENLAVTLSAQALVTPVIASNFHQFSLVGVVANLLILWTIPYIMVGGGVLLALSFLWSLPAQILSLGLNTLLTYFIYVVNFFASLPFAWEYVGEVWWIVWVGYYMVLTAIMLSLIYAKKENSAGS